MSRKFQVSELQIGMYRKIAGCPAALIKTLSKIVCWSNFKSVSSINTIWVFSLGSHLNSLTRVVWTSSAISAALCTRAPSP